MLKTNKTIHFIINPISGIGTKELLPTRIDSSFKKKSEYKIYYTEYPGHAREITKKIANANEYMVVVVGGDGTINEVVIELINSKTLLGIIPSGSGNGFANHLNIPFDIKKAIQVIKTGNYQKVDVGKFENHYFISNCGIGFDAKIAKEFSTYKSRGFLSYAKLCLKYYFKHKNITVNIKVDEKEVEEKTGFLISIVNTSEFGNGFVIAPNNNHNDGLFELLIFNKPNLINLPFTIFRFFTKSIRKSKYIKYYKGSKFEISPIKIIQKDGDFIHESFNEIKIYNLKQSIKVVC